MVIISIASLPDCQLAILTYSKIFALKPVRETLSEYNFALKFEANDEKTAENSIGGYVFTTQ